MKRITTIVLVVAMLISLVACGGTKQESTGQTALEILETVWDSYSENQKFAIMGGGPEFEQSVMDAPGAFELKDEDTVDSVLGFPSSSVALLKEAASMMHAMNQNTFTAGAYHISKSGDVEMLISDLEDNILNRQWMCGFPDRLLIVKVDQNTLISAFGEETNIEYFKDRILTAYPASEIVVEESLMR